MKTIVTACVVLLAAVVSVGAQEKRSPKGVAGAWEMTVKGPAAHGDMTATMELEQEDSKVTGRLTAHGSTHALAGEFKDGELSLETTDTTADHEMTLKARLSEDGRLNGYLSSSMGDMQWTAARVDRAK
jgi:hypothetical protein